MGTRKLTVKDRVLRIVDELERDYTHYTDVYREQARLKILDQVIEEAAKEMEILRRLAEYKNSHSIKPDALGRS